MIEKLISKSDSTIISIEDLKAQLRLLDDDSFDIELVGIIATAQDLIEGITGRWFADRQMQINISSFREFTFNHKNIANVVVTYLDVDGVEQTLSTDNYIVDFTGEYPNIYFKNVPAVQTSVYDYPISVTFTVEADTLINQRIKHAMLIAGYELFEVRGETTDKARSKAEITIRRLLGSEVRVVI